VSCPCVVVQDAAGHHSSALFVQWVPYELQGTTWEAEEERYTQHLLDIVDTFAPGAASGSCYGCKHPAHLVCLCGCVCVCVCIVIQAWGC